MTADSEKWGIVVAEFAVQPPALRELAKLLDRAREDVDASRTHLTRFMDFQGGEGVINLLTQGHRDAYRALDDWLGRLGDPTLTTVSGAVTSAAAYYERTDRGSAENLDSTYPETYVTEAREHTGYVPIEPPEGTGAFQDVTEPQQHRRSTPTASWSRSTGCAACMSVSVIPARSW